METNTISVFLIAFSILTIVRGFLPNGIGLNTAKDDYTLEKITREAILVASETYLQQQRSSDANVSLTVYPLTENSLFEVYYGGEVSPKNFAGNIISIMTSAMKFCRTGNPAPLFLNERIVDGLTLLLSLRSDLESVLNNTVTVKDYDFIREMIGAIICVQSSFYSNTNWVEENGRQLYTHLGIASNDVVRISDSSLDTCTDCFMVNGSLNCSSNLLSGTGLTSGYISSKPAGKCGYGGLFDPVNRLSGGINKATSDPRYSPHYYLHEIAGQSAVEAAVNLFLDPYHGILNRMGDTTFKELFGLGTGVTLCIVMDTTGSMLDDINAVAMQTESLVNGRAGSVHSPESFIFVPFADPDVGPVQEAYNASVFLSILRSVVPTGGGDCPEMGLTGILTAIKATKQFSEIFIFSDAAAKDGELADQVLATALSKQTRLHFLLTGKCPDGEAQFPDLYAEIAAQTGGKVFYSSKSDIDEATQVIDFLSGADQVSLLNFLTDGQRDLTIPVDDTLRDFSVFVSSKAGTYLPGMALYSPKDIAIASTIQTTNLVAFKVENATTGNWRLHLDSPVPGLKVEVVGSGSLNVHLQMFEESEDGLAFPITGRPIAGQNITFGVSILSDSDVANLTTLILVDSAGNIISQLPVTYSSSDFLTATTTIPNEGFRVLLTGVDSTGNTIYRLVDDFHEPQDFKLELQEPNPILVTPGDFIELPYTIHSAGQGLHNFTVTLTDADGGMFNTTFYITGNSTNVLRINVSELNLADFQGQSVLSLILSTSMDGSPGTNYNNVRLLISNTSTVLSESVMAEYILPTTPAPPTTSTLPTLSSTPKTQESKAVRDDTPVIAGAVVGVVALTGVVSVLSARKFMKTCKKVSPYSYPKPKPMVAKPNLKADFM